MWYISKKNPNSSEMVSWIVYLNRLLYKRNLLQPVQFIGINYEEPDVRKFHIRSLNGLHYKV